MNYRVNISKWGIIISIYSEILENNGIITYNTEFPHNPSVKKVISRKRYRELRFALGNFKSAFKEEYINQYAH